MGAAIGLALLAAAATAQVELVSRANPIQDSNADSFQTDGSMSRDGRYIAFESWAPNVVPGQVDGNTAPDVFLHDRVAGTTVLVSHVAGRPKTAPPGRIRSFAPRISPDGRYVAFLSGADNLVPGQVDTNDVLDLFLWDRLTDTTALVSHVAGAPTTAADEGGSSFSYWSVFFSDDNAYLAFQSFSSDLVAGQPEPDLGSRFLNVFLYDVRTGSNLWVSRSTPLPFADVSSEVKGISADGAYVVFSSDATDILPGIADTNGQADVFLYHRPSGTTRLVSQVPGAPLTAAGGFSRAGGLSADGRFVLFASTASNLVPGQVRDPKSGGDVYLYDRTTGVTTLVSHAAGSALTEAGGAPLAFTPDGRYVVFTSDANNVVPGQVDANAKVDLFLYDRLANSSKLVSRTRASDRTASSALFFEASISANGRYVVYSSEAGDVVSGQAGGPAAGLDVFLFDASTSRSTLVSRAGNSGASSGDRPSDNGRISADGAFILFESEASNLGDGQVDTLGHVDLFLYERSTGQITPVSHHAPGAGSVTPEGGSGLTSMSADGRYVVFVSTAFGLTPGTDNNVYDDGFEQRNGEDVFLYDRVERKVTLVSHAAGSAVDTADGISRSAAISADGRYVAFTSTASDLIDGLVEAPFRQENVFLYDRVTGTTTLVSHSRTSAQAMADSSSSGPSISADGRYVAFTSRAHDLVAGQFDSNPGDDVFLWDRATGGIVLVSHAAGAPATTGNQESLIPVISADGRYVVYPSKATDLVSGQVGPAGGQYDLFLFDRETRANVMISRVAGTPAVSSGGFSSSASFSADGRYIAFGSSATNLVPGQVDTNAEVDIFLYDRVSGVTALVSHSASSPTTAAAGRSPAFRPVAISADGRYVSFQSNAVDLVPGSTLPVDRATVFLYDRVGGAVTLVSHAASSRLAGASGGGPVISADGRFIVYESDAPDLIAGALDPANATALLRYDRTTDTTTLVSRTPAAAATVANHWSRDPLISADGRWVAFESYASNLVAGDFNADWDVFLYGAGAAGGLTPVPACKLLDTRRAADGPAVVSGRVETIQARGACGIPTGATAISVRVLVLNATAPGELAFHPGGTASGTPAARMAFPAGPRRARVLTLPLSAEGLLTLKGTLQGQGRAHVVLEVTGYRQ